jgi:DNA replication protein DnaC
MDEDQKVYSLLKGKKPQTCDVWKVIIFFFSLKPCGTSDKQNESDYQKSVFNLAINGHNLLITGQGGTGKSFLVKIIIKHLRTKVNKKVAIVCSKPWHRS